VALVLLVEDDALLRWAMGQKLARAGFVVHEASSLAEARQHLAAHRPELVLLDLALPDGHGIELLQREKDKLEESVVIVVTASANVEDAVRAMKAGAFDLLTKPVEDAELLRVLEEGLTYLRGTKDTERRRRIQERGIREEIVAASPAMQGVLELANTVAGSSATSVLILGETGVGKEVVARYIHRCSPRAAGPFEVLNCAAMPDTLVESELFGHERGAFTDARTSRKGVVELADGGTFVLDEVGELPLPLQAKLLRFLETRSFRRLGGEREITVDVRIIALTNRDLAKEVQEGRFRSDLYYRLSVFPILVPPLRQRKEDILPLARHFLAQFSRTAGKSFHDLAPEFAARLQAYSWPGNVRELRNVMERVAILESGGLARGDAVVFGEAERAAPCLEEEGALLSLDEAEWQLVVRAMRKAQGNQSAAAKLLGISRDQLRYRVKQYKAQGRWPKELA